MKAFLYFFLLSFAVSALADADSSLENNRFVEKSALGWSWSLFETKDCSYFDRVHRSNITKNCQQISVDDIRNGQVCEQAEEHAKGVAFTKCHKLFDRCSVIASDPRVYIQEFDNYNNQLTGCEVQVVVIGK
ncbi:MAG: hypothetical protein ACXVCP_09630 [Bdellovibrio sp.]